MPSKPMPSRGIVLSFPALTLSWAGRSEEVLQEAEKPSWKRGASNWPFDGGQLLPSGKRWTA